MIVGGDTARLGQFPYQIQISVEATLEFCGASLARVQGTQVVITSAQNVASYYPSDILLRGGVLNWDEDNFLIQSRYPSRIISHPDFDPISLQNDIALIFFSVPFLRTQNVNWVSLPERFKEVAPGTNVTVTGWGQQSEDWGDYTDRVFGTKDDDTFAFLFDMAWPDDKKQCAARALTYLKSGIPDSGVSDFERLFLKSYSKKKLVEGLSEFII